MSDICKHAHNDENGADRKESMKALRQAMRVEHNCLQDNMHCASARQAIITSMHSVMQLDKEYFSHFFKEHQTFVAHFSDYKYVEEMAALICIVESWYTMPGDILPGDPSDPYGNIGWIGGLNLHIHASLYFGFTRKDMLRLFQIVQEIKEIEINEIGLPNFEMPTIELADSEDWMLYFVATVTLKFRVGVQYMESRRAEFNISDELRDDILGAIRSTYWWKNMMMSRIIDFSAEGLPPEILEKI